MSSHERIKIPVKISGIALLFILLTTLISIVSVSADQEGTSASLGKTKSMAEAQHEIVVLLIQKKEYEKAAAEANKIFEMRWPEDQEPLLVKEMRTLTDQFLRSGQASVGLRLIERNFGRFKTSSSQAALLKEMGYLHKHLNQNDKALDCFKKALDLEGGK